jgi:hypothetical protein
LGDLAALRRAMLARNAAANFSGEDLAIEVLYGNSKNPTFLRGILTL